MSLDVLKHEDVPPYVKEFIERMTMNDPAALSHLVHIMLIAFQNGMKDSFKMPFFLIDPSKEDPIGPGAIMFALNTSESMLSVAFISGTKQSIMEMTEEINDDRKGQSKVPIGVVDFSNTHKA